jgi:hypothetical protein
MDGGVRRGVDVVKALARGADSVACGRAYLYGLAAGGFQGVRCSVLLDARRVPRRAPGERPPRRAPGEGPARRAPRKSSLMRTRRGPTREIDDSPL